MTSLGLILCQPVVIHLSCRPMLVVLKPMSEETFFLCCKTMNSLPADVIDVGSRLVAFAAHYIVLTLVRSLLWTNI